MIQIVCKVCKQLWSCGLSTLVIQMTASYVIDIMAMSLYYTSKYDFQNRTAKLMLRYCVNFLYENNLLHSICFLWSKYEDILMIDLPSWIDGKIMRYKTIQYAKILLNNKRRIADENHTRSIICMWQSYNQQYSIINVLNLLNNS